VRGKGELSEMETAKGRPTGTRDVARAAERDLALDEDVRDILRALSARSGLKGGYAHLFLAQQRQVQQNLERLRVGSQNDKLGDAAVERLRRCMPSSVPRTAARENGRTLVRALLQHLIVGCLLHEVHDLQATRQRE
jgi:hypothetical protein